LAAQIQTVYYISGFANRKGTGQLRPVFVQPGFPMEPPVPGEYSLELLDANGRSLLSLPFFVTFVDVEGIETDSFYFDFQIPAREGTAEIQLRHGRTLLDTIRISKNAPTVAVRSPNGGEQWKGAQTIEWTAEDADRDALTFNILYTPNDGETWIPVASGIQRNTYDLDTDTLPGGTQARIRVVATDGFNTSQDDSDAVFTVVNKAPQPRIVQPRPTQTWLAGDLIRFQADPGDLDDASLPETSMFWFDGPRLFGIGPKVEAAFPEGAHEVTLYVMDSQGLMSQTTMPLTVLADSGIRLQALRLKDGSIRLSWPAAVRGTLETARDPAGSYKDAGLPVTIEGDEAVVLIRRPDPGHAFFRLQF
jgi:hypothetical protein